MSVLVIHGARLREVGYISVGRSEEFMIDTTGRLSRQSILHVTNTCGTWVLDFLHFWLEGLQQ